MMTTRRVGWNMQDEKEFIDLLGTGVLHELKEGEIWPSRTQLLARYIKALEKRVDWDVMMRKEVMAYARESFGNVKI